MIAVGTILHGTYRIDAELGRGGMGRVFSATHMRLPRRVAVKVLMQTTDAQALKRFRREAEICSQMGQRNIVEVYDFNDIDGQPYIVMELLEGESLRKRLDREPILPRTTIADMVREIGKALTAAHAAGVVHRDLKPANLFLCREGIQERVKVLDFGISKIMGGTSLQTADDSLLGTPGYMSPEQARSDGENVTAAADQFSLAAIVYEALSGRPAFVGQGDTPYTVLYKIIKREPPTLENESPAVREVLARALAKQPQDRFADVSAFVAALTAALDAGGPGATRPRPRRWWLAAAAVVSACVAAAVVTAVVRSRRGPAAPAPAKVDTAPAKADTAPPAPTPPVPSSLAQPAPASGEPVVVAPSPRDAGAGNRVPATPPSRPAGPRKKPAPPPRADDELSNPYREAP